MKNILIVLLISGGGYYFWNAGLIQKFVGQQQTHNNIIVYSAADCKACDAVVKTIEQEGFAVTVFYIDQEPGTYERLRESLGRVGYNRRIPDLPVVDIFGKILTDSPSPKKVRQHLPRD
ncbi:glutaredoxin family protein [Pseudomonadota bacterium]